MLPPAPSGSNSPRNSARWRSVGCRISAQGCASQPSTMSRASLGGSGFAMVGTRVVSRTNAMRTSQAKPTGSVPDSVVSSHDLAPSWKGEVSSTAYTRRLTSGSFTRASLGQSLFAKSLFVFKICSQLKGVRQIDAHTQRPRRSSVRLCTTPLSHESRAYSGVQRLLKGNIALAAEGFELFCDVGIERHGRAKRLHSAIITAAIMLSRC
jgi:hypothetical protein